MEQVWPDFVRQAPVERTITRNWSCSSTTARWSASTTGTSGWRAPVNAVTVLRAKLDAWLGEQCESAGVTVMPGMHVDALVREGERVVGIRAGEDDLRAHVVVAADGVNSFLCRDAGIRAKEPHEAPRGRREVRDRAAARRDRGPLPA